jgi:hypothetical protein
MKVGFYILFFLIWPTLFATASHTVPDSTILLSEYLSILEDQHPVQFSYKRKHIRKERIPLPVPSNLQRALIKLEESTPLTYYFVSEKSVVISPKQVSNQLTIYVFDHYTHDPIPLSSVEINGVKRYTNDLGMVLINPPGDSIAVTISSFGYYPKVIRWGPSEMNRPPQIRIYLKSIHHIDKIRKSLINTPGRSNGSIHLNSNRTQVISLTGSSDLLQELKTHDGVQGGTENTPGLSVLGGAPENNQVLLDGLKVFNPTHLFGLLSVFHEGGYRNGDLYQDYVPSSMAGGLSSTLNVTSRNGNKEVWSGQGGIGLLHADFLVNGPIIKNKWSVSLSGRRSYIDAFSGILNGLSSTGPNNFNYLFYDVNFRTDLEINAKQRISFSYFRGGDDAKTVTRTGTDLIDERVEQAISWSNVIYALNHHARINQNWVFRQTAGISQYENGITDEYRFTREAQPPTIRNIRSGNGISEYKYRGEFKHYLKTSRLSMGVEGLSHRFLYGDQRYRYSDASNQVDTNLNRVSLRGYQLNVFTDWEKRMRHFEFQTGFRYVVYQFEDRIRHLPEPRIQLSIPYRNHRLSFSFFRGVQFISMVSGSVAGFPAEQWLPNTLLGEPPVSNTYSAQYQYSHQQHTFQLSGTYRTWDRLNRLNTRSLPLFSDVNGLMQNIRSGEGFYRSLRFFYRFFGSNQNATFSYTWSKNSRRFVEINGGEWFAANLDRRHDINFSYERNLKKNLLLRAQWSFLSGNPVTLPDGIFTTQVGADTITVIHFSDINNYRFPDYQRLDITLQWSKEHRFGVSKFTAGVYNVYNHFNPFDLYIGFDDNENRVLIERTYFPILPMFHYTFLWN